MKKRLRKKRLKKLGIDIYKATYGLWRSQLKAAPTTITMQAVLEAANEAIEFEERY